MNDLPLRDIHLPDPVSWWPLASGWWILISLLVVTIIAFLLTRILRKRPARLNYRKQALKQLQSIRQSKQMDSIQLLREISQLLRRIALSYLPRQQVASLTGQQWITQLNQLSNDTIFNEDDTQLISQASYRPQADYNRDALLDHCEQWIKQLPDKPARQEISK